MTEWMTRGSIQSRPGGPPRRLTVSIIVGALHPRDGISNAVLQQVDALSSSAAGEGMDLRIYAFEGSSASDSRIVEASSPLRVAAEEHFQRSDLIVLHFGFYFSLFDIIHLCPSTAQVIVVYYGITPPALARAAVQPSIHASYRQAANLLAADRVIVFSRHLREEVRRMGVPPERIRQLPLAGGLPRLESASERKIEAPTVLAYLGRFVKSKGIKDLLEAIAPLVEKGVRLRLDLMGSLTYSDGEYLGELRQMRKDLKLENAMEFYFDLSSEEISRRLGAADALVIPSHHEGFCVPVIEAFSIGCFVIASDAGALPETSGGLARSYPVGNVDALANRIEELINARGRKKVIADSGEFDLAQWTKKAKEYCEGFTIEHCGELMVEALLQGMTPTPLERRDLLAEARYEFFKQASAGATPSLATPKYRRAIQKVLDDIA